MPTRNCDISLTRCTGVQRGGNFILLSEYFIFFFCLISYAQIRVAPEWPQAGLKVFDGTAENCVGPDGLGGAVLDGLGEEPCWTR